MNKKNARPTEVKASALSKRRHDTAPDLFPATLPPVVPAVWPSEGSRAHAALLALLEGPQNQADYGPGWRLAAYVQDLEYRGWRILSRLFKHPRCKPLIAEYTIDRQDPATAAALSMRPHLAKGMLP